MNKITYIAVMLILSTVTHAQTNQLSFPVDTSITKIDSANIKELKDIVSPLKDVLLKKTLEGLIECWYMIDRKKGISPRTASLKTLNQLTETILELK